MAVPIVWNGTDANNLAFNNYIGRNPSNGFGLWGDTQTYGFQFNSPIFSDLQSKYGWTADEVKYLQNNPQLQNQLFQNGTFQFNNGNVIKNGDMNARSQVQAAMNGNGTNSGGLFGGSSTDQFGNKTFAGGTGLQWAGFGANLGLGLWGAYQQHKQTKLAQQAFEEQKALQRANYKMQAKSFNNSLRNQQSGRGFVGMSGSAKRTLGREYDARKAEETY